MPLEAIGISTIACFSSMKGYSPILSASRVIGALSRDRSRTISISVNLLLATFSKVLGDASGSVIALLIIAVIAAEAALFLAMTVHIYRSSRTIDSDHFDKLREGVHNA